MTAFDDDQIDIGVISRYISQKFPGTIVLGDPYRVDPIEMYKMRDDKLAKTVYARLMSVSDLVAAEARHHVACQSIFENPIPKNATSGRPVSTEKFKCFEEACVKLEDDVELYTVTEFHELMESLGKDTYTVKMAHEKLKQKMVTH